MKKCALCDWQGADLSPVATQMGGVIYLCSACIHLPMENLELGNVQPAKLVPVMRAVAAQAVNSVMSQMLGGLVRLIGKLGQQGLDLAQQAQVLEEIIDRVQGGIPLKDDEPKDYGPN